MLPETLAHKALDAVAPYRGLNMLACYRQPKSRIFALVILPENHKIIITGTSSRGKYALEFTTLGQTLSAGKTPRG